MKNGKQGAAELRRLMAMAKPLKTEGAIVAPESALAARAASYRQEWGNVWTMREAFVEAILSSGNFDAATVVDEAEAIARECVRRRVTEALDIGAITGQSSNEGFEFLAKALGVELPEAPAPTLAEQPKLVQGPGAA